MTSAIRVYATVATCQWPLETGRSTVVGQVVRGASVRGTVARTAAEDVRPGVTFRSSNARAMSLFVRSVAFCFESQLGPRDGSSIVRHLPLPLSPALSIAISSLEPPCPLGRVSLRRQMEGLVTARVRTRCYHSVAR